jgi:energy-converting hydrogenase Eha subunit H
MTVAQGIGFGAIAHLGDPVLRIVAILGWGAASSFFGPMTVAALPSFFGRSNLGAISAVQMMCLVVASALGPSALAASRELFGSYNPALYASCALPVAVFALGLRMRDPQRG